MHSAILDHPRLSARYFFPGAARVSPEVAWERPLADGGALRHARIGAGPDWLVFFHGNGEVAADWVDVLPPMAAAAGFSTLLVEYRGYGGSDGEPALAAMLDDGTDAVSALGARRLVAMGRSIGSLYAVALSRRRRLDGLVLESGLCDLVERVLVRCAPAELGTDDAGLRAEVARCFDQEGGLRAFPGPTLLLHADDDDLVDVSHAIRNAAACARPTLVRFPHGGHNAILARNQRAYAEALRAFLAAA